MSDRRSWLPSHTMATLAAITVLYAAAIWARPVDGDEGLYLTAFDEVAAGRSLYRDVLYFQFPGLPYLFAPWLRFVSGPSPAGVRALSFLFSVGTVFLVAGHARAARASAAATTLAVAATGFSGLMLGWASTIKTYPFCVFCSVAAFAALAATRRRAHASVLAPLAAGLALGAAGSARFFYLACLAIAVVWLVWDGATRGDAKGGLRSAGLALLGSALPLALVTHVAAGERDAFWFCTVTFHGFRNEQSAMVGNWSQKADVLWSLAKHLQLGALVAAAAWTLRRGRATGAVDRDAVLALVWCSALAVMQFLPTPTLTQYYVNVVPLLVVSALPAFEALAGARTRVLRGVVAAYLLYAPYETYWLEIKPMAGGWCPFTVAGWDRLAATIERETRPDERVLAWWPGIVTSGHRRLVHGFENNFPYMAWKRIPADVRARYGIPDSQRVADLVADEEPALVLLRRKFFFPKRETYEALVTSNYDLVAEEEDFLVFKRRTVR